MCGIAAILMDGCDAASVAQSRAWGACMRSIARRGPDGSGTWSSPSAHAVLGHTRLAIIDPTDRGAQPMVRCDGNVAITYNGEIYNAPELCEALCSLGHQFDSTCDTEVLLHGWLQWGEGVLERAEGMYAFAIWDDRVRRLFAAVDHAGMKPLYWKHNAGRLIIASDADAIRAVTGAEESIDPVALRQLLTLSCCPAPRTMWEGISKLEPGGVLRWQPGTRPEISTHWRPPEGVDPSISADLDAFGALFERVVAEHMQADVPVGAFLSGGLDSAGVVYAAVRAGVLPKCFTLSMYGQDDESSDASRIAQGLGLHHIIAPAGEDIARDLTSYQSAYDEPQGYSALLNATRISVLARPHVRSVVTGDGGDEAFGGYLWQREQGPEAWQYLTQRGDLLRDAKELSTKVASPDADDASRKRARQAFGTQSFTHAYASRVFPGFHPAEAMALTASMGGHFDEQMPVDWLATHDRSGLPHVRRVQRLDLLGFCAASVLPKIDRAAMHVGLETRSPFLDRRLLAVGMAAPVVAGEDDPSGASSRTLLRAYVAKHLGQASTTRPKQGFSLRIQSEFAWWSACADTIDRSHLVQSGLIRPDWRDFVPVGDTPRLRLLAMLSAWAQPRL